MANNAQYSEDGIGMLYIKDVRGMAGTLGDR